MTEPSSSYANAWLALLPQVHLPTMAAQAVARECARFADWGTGENVRPGRKRLAWNLNTSQDSVKVAISVLVAHGVLDQVEHGGRSGPRKVAAVYRLSVPEHLATPENLATFPDPALVCVVPASRVVRGDPKYPDNAPAGNGLPAENPQGSEPSGEPAPPPAGNGLPAQRVTGSPPPSIDPPDTLQENPRADAQAAADADGRTQEQVNADGLRAARQALQEQQR